MPYRPVSRPQSFQSLSPEQRTGDDVGMRTVASSPEKAKLRAATFMRGTRDPGDRSPAWGPDSRSFSEQRQLNPDAFTFWGDQLATTNAGSEFVAPVESTPLTSEQEYL